MKHVIYIPLAIVWISTHLHGQNSISKAFSTRGVQKVQLDLQYANADISYWDIEAVKLTAEINLNGSFSADILNITEEKSGNILEIWTKADLMHEWGHYLKSENGQHIHLEKDQDRDDQVKKIGELGENVTLDSGYDLSIDIHFKIPKNLELDVKSLYGSVIVVDPPMPVQVRNVYGNADIVVHRSKDLKSMDVKSTYGYVDVTLPEATNCSLELKTAYGKIYSDMDIYIVPGAERGTSHPFGEDIEATLNAGGTLLQFEASYGDIYLRKK